MPGSCRSARLPVSHGYRGPPRRLRGVPVVRRRIEFLSHVEPPCPDITRPPSGRSGRQMRNARRRAQGWLVDFLPYDRYRADRRRDFGSTGPAMRLRPQRRRQIRGALQKQIPTPARLEFPIWGDRWTYTPGRRTVRSRSNCCAIPSKTRCFASDGLNRAPASRDLAGQRRIAAWPSPHPQCIRGEYPAPRSLLAEVSA